MLYAYKIHQQYCQECFIFNLIMNVYVRKGIPLSQLCDNSNTIRVILFRKHFKT